MGRLDQLRKLLLLGLVYMMRLSRVVGEAGLDVLERGCVGDVRHLGGALFVVTFEGQAE